MSNDSKRVHVFIDNSNIFKRLVGLNNSVPDNLKWPKSYDPQFLAQSLAGSRRLVKTWFYCSPPPEYLKTKLTKDGKKIYWVQSSYYQEIQKMTDVELKYGYLTGPSDDLQEKNLDSQLITDMQRLAYKNEFDTAIIVAGDGDYLSVIRAVKEIGKRVELAYFKGQGSLALIQECDLSRRIRRSFFKSLPFPYNEDSI